MNRRLVSMAMCVVLATPASAESARPFSGFAEKLVFVSDTQLPSRSGNHALCARVSDWHFFFIPFQRTVSEYVFSETDCGPDAVHAIPAQRIAMSKAAGILPAHIPDEPSLPLIWNLHNKGGVILALLALLGIPLFLCRRGYLKTHLCAHRSGDPIYYDVLLTLLFHTAGRDGVVDEAELQAILQTYKNLTGTRVTPAITAEKFALRLTDDAMLHLVKSYRGAEAELLMDAAIRIATDRGSLSREKRRLLTRLNAVLDRDPDSLDLTLDAAVKLSKTSSHNLPLTA